MRLAIAAVAAAAGLLLASCAQDVKISSPRYALVIGVQDYPNVQPLHYTLNDANAMSDALIKQGWKTTLARESEATRAGIVADIANLASTVEPNSTVLFYYSGHGSLTNDGTQAIIAPWDTNFQKDALNNTIEIDGVPQLNEDTVISASQFASMLAALPTNRVIVILDSCYSGGFVSSGAAKDLIPQNYGLYDGGTLTGSLLGSAFADFGSLLSANASSSGRTSPIVMSAAGSLEFSYDGTAAMQHGVFTYYLLESMTEGDSNGDGVVTTTEAYAYTANRLNSLWNSQYQYYVDSGLHMDFYPHISGGARDLVLFTK